MMPYGWNLILAREQKYSFVYFSFSWRRAVPPPWRSAARKKNSQVENKKFAAVVEAQSSANLLGLAFDWVSLSLYFRLRQVSRSVWEL